MRHRGAWSAIRGFLSLSVIVVVAIVPLVGAGDSAAASNSPSVTVLPTGFGSIVVDATHDHVFVSSPSSNTVSVLNFAGTVLSTLPGMSAPGSMTVYGGSLYVLTSGGIDVFDTGTLSQTGTLASGQLVDPRPLVEAAGLLWTSSGACYGSSTELASVDPSTGKVTLWPPPANSSLGYCIGLASSPYNPNLLLAWDTGLSPATITEFNVSGGSPTVVTSGSGADLESLQQLAFDPDGTTFVAAAAAPSNFDEFRLSDLSADSTAYEQSGAPGYPNAVATTAGRGGVIAGSASGTFSAGFAWGPGHITPAESVPENATPYPSGVALAPDGMTMFDVVDTNGGTTELLTSTIVSSTTVQLSAPSSLRTGQEGTITATVSGDLQPAPTGTVTFSDNGTQVATVALSSSRASWSASWASAGDHDITATYGGDSLNTPSSASAQIAVGDPTTTTLSVSPNPGTQGSPVQLVATVSASVAPAGSVTFYEVNNGMSSTLASVPVSQGTSSYSATLNTSGTVQLYATYNGDQSNLGSTSNTVDEQLNPAPGVSLNTTSLSFGDQRVATFGDPQTVTVTNSGSQTLEVTNIVLDGGAVLDYAGATTCDAPVNPGGSCQITLLFSPTEIGSRTTTMVIYDNAPDTRQALPLTGVGTEGYYIASAGGGVAAGGDALPLGDLSGIGLNAPLVSMTTTPDGDGYWLLGGDGGIFTFGDAGFYGSTGGMRLNRPVVGMAPTPDGRGYWLVASDGGIFTFGDAPYMGSLGGSGVTDIIGMAPTAPPLDPYRADHVTAASIGTRG